MWNGYLIYLTEEERNQFLLNDYFRTNSYRANKIDFFNSGQLSLQNEINNYKKVFVSAPTSFGKTSIVNEYVLNNIDDLRMIIYIVPTNSLLEELYTKFLTYFSNYKNINITTQPLLKSGKKNMLILTPEKFLILIEKINLSEVSLIMMDESYKIMDFNNDDKERDFVNERSFKFRKVAEIIASSDNKVVFLSPFTYKNQLR